jgi:hypothetical protein
MDVETAISVTAIICLTALEVVNLLTARVDSALLMLIASIIGGIGGYKIRARRARGRA